MIEKTGGPVVHTQLFLHHGSKYYTNEGCQMLRVKPNKMEVKLAAIFAYYVCSIPQRKDAGSILLA